MADLPVEPTGTERPEPGSVRVVPSYLAFSMWNNHRARQAGKYAKAAARQPMYAPPPQPPVTRRPCGRRGTPPDISRANRPGGTRVGGPGRRI